MTREKAKQILKWQAEIDDPNATSYIPAFSHRIAKAAPIIAQAYLREMDALDIAIQTLTAIRKSGCDYPEDPACRACLAKEALDKIEAARNV